MADLLMKMPIPYEPKRQNRFILRFPSSLGINEWFVESSARPHIVINPVPIPFLNTETYVAGKFTWQTIPAVFRDPIGPWPEFQGPALYRGRERWFRWSGWLCQNCF